MSSLRRSSRRHPSTVAADAAAAAAAAAVAAAFNEARKSRRTAKRPAPQKLSPPPPKERRRFIVKKEREKTPPPREKPKELKDLPLPVVKAESQPAPRAPVTQQRRPRTSFVNLAKEVSDGREPTVKEVIATRIKHSGGLRALAATPLSSPLNGDSAVESLDKTIADVVSRATRAASPQPVFALDGVPYVPFSSLLDGDGFRVPLDQKVSLEGGKHAPQEMSLEEALRKMGLCPSACSQQHFPQDLLQEMKQAGLLVHHAFAQGGVSLDCAHVDITKTAFNPFVSSASQPPFIISNPEHLNRFIGALVGAGGTRVVATSSAASSSSPTPSLKREEKTESKEKVVEPKRGSKALSLTEKILLVADFDAGKSEAELAEKYAVGPETVAEVLSNRVTVIREQARLLLDRKQTRVRRTHFVGLNIMMWKLFKDCAEAKIFLTGKQLREHALQVARHLGIEDFKASEGWLDAFKRRHCIDLKTMTGKPVRYEEDDEGNICVIGEQEGAAQTAAALASGEGSRPATATATASVRTTSPLELTGGEVRVQRPQSSSSTRPKTSLVSPAPTDESLVASIVRSAATRIDDAEVSAAVETLRAFILARDPSLMPDLARLHSRLAVLAAKKTEEHVDVVSLHLG